jgi:hypothetical protein
MQAQQGNIVAEEFPEQVNSAIGIAPSMTSLGEDYDLTLDSSTWLNDSLPEGFMDFAGAPDFDSLMWDVFNNN